MQASRIRRGGYLYGGVAVVCAVMITVAVVLAVHHTRPTRPAAVADPVAVVATVDGIAVPVRELQLFLGRERAATFAYFLERNGVSDGPKFWTTRFGGQTPTDHVKKLAVDDAINATVQRNLARAHRVLTNPGYPAFLADLQAENARRTAALAARQPVYGPQQYTEDDYFTYQMSQIHIRLQDDLVDAGTIAPTSTALRQYFDAHRATYPQPFDQVKDEVTQDFESAGYDKVIAQAVASAKVQIDADVLASVTVS